MTQIELRQLENNVEVIGTIKSKELEIKKSKLGANYITGKLVLESKFDSRVHEQIIKVFVMASSNLYPGILTVLNEYQVSDRIKVRGLLKLCEYYNNQGNLIQFNEVRGMHFNRLDTNNTDPDKAAASVDTIIDSFSEKLGADGLPTGEYYVNGFTVGYKNEVIELKNVVIGPEIAGEFINLYQPGSTGQLFYQFNNYAESNEQTEATERTHAFGKVVTIETPNANKKVVRNIEIVSGDFPYSNGHEYTQFEIANAKKVRATAISNLVNKSNTSTSQKNTAFSKSVIVPSLVSDDSLPDF